VAVNEYAEQAPFMKREEDGECGDDRLMEYAGQRALGKTPPGGRRSRRKNKDKKGGDRINKDEGNMTVADVLVSAACANVIQTGNDTSEGVAHNACSPYLRMGSSSSLLDEAEITKRLSFMERSELSAVLDSEVERAATFYRSRIAELSPPRADGGTCPTFTACGAGLEHVYDCERSRAAGSVCATGSVAEDARSLMGSLAGTNDDDELIAPSQDREQLSFAHMASEILELHAFITTNIIVVRQVLIKYDAFVRSLGGAPMGSWYQTTRRQRVKGRSSDYRDLVNHSKLKKLTKAYINEYKRHREEAKAGANDGADESLASGRTKSGKRLKDLSRAFYKIVDAGEELKKTQRLKWRQSAMHLDDDNDDLGDRSEGGASSGSLDGRRPRTPTSLPDSLGLILETPLPRLDTSPPLGSLSLTRSPTTTAQQTPTPRSHSRIETPSPEPPIHSVPDYSTLQTISAIGEDIAYQVHIFKCIQSKTQRSIEKSYSGKISGVYDNFVCTLREYFLLGSVSDNLSLMPEYLIMRGKSLKSSLLVVAQWRETRNAYRHRPTKQGNGYDGLRDEQWLDGFCGESQPPSPQPCGSFKESFSLFLNILACFLYMMNYYIVEPSSTRYANALGVGDSMSGLIIGAMPWAAISSAIVYSVWSNRCYKAPLLTSGVLLTLGNVLYATAYRHGSITMALCGRFLTGLGGPRSLNRRYIADTTPLARRTAVNAAFGTATAMGAALGPATAIMLDGVNIAFDVPVYGTVYLNGMTGPGFFMGGLWVAFTVVMALTFDEPRRSGLEEQMRKELLETEAGATMTNTLPVPMLDGISPLKSEYEMSNLDASSNNHIRRQLNSTSGGEETINYLDDVRETRVLDSFGCPTPDEREICNRSEICCPSANDGSRALDRIPHENYAGSDGRTMWQQAKFIAAQISFPVRICMFLLFSKMFTVESVISAASMVTKNRYSWAVHQVGTLGTIVGCLTIPISIFIGWASQYREDRVLMIWLMSFAVLGMALLIDVTDFVSAETATYNEDRPMAVGPYRYIAGYLLVFCSVQAFDGVVGSVLSKVIPTALATGTLNSGLLATVIGTFGRACGDVFITSVGYINLRHIMNLLFVPSFVILLLDLILICYNYDSLTA